MSDGKPRDPVADAIAATSTPADNQVKMEQTTVTIASTGRPMIIAYPQDMSDEELLEVLAWMAGPLRGHLQQLKKGPASRIIVPGPPGRLA